MSASKSVLFPLAGSLLPFISSTPAHPMTMAFASTFLCSQEIHGLASMADAHQARATGSARQSQERLSHIIAQVQVHPAAV